MTEDAQFMLWILQMHVWGMFARLRQIPDSKWDWAFAPPALAGAAPYAAPFPNPIYADLHKGPADVS